MSSVATLHRTSLPRAQVVPGCLIPSARPSEPSEVDRCRPGILLVQGHEVEEMTESEGKPGSSGPVAPGARPQTTAPER